MVLFIIICIVIAIFSFNKLTCKWCSSKVCLVGKTAIITGGNSGIGYQVALSLASRGCRIIIADKDDASGSRDKIISQSNNQNVIVKKLDLASLDSVRSFAKNIVETEPQINILINNAGIGTIALNYTADGLQKTMQVNYFGHFLLTYLLVDLMKKSAPSRIIFTSSIAAFLTRVDPENLNPLPSYSQNQQVYPNSKLCLMIAAKVFAKKLKGTGVTVNSLHPGGARSGIFSKAFKEERSLYPLIAGLLTLPFGKNTEEAAQTTIHLACDQKVVADTGSFFMECRKFVQPYQTYNIDLCNRVFENTKALVKLEPSECVI
ncbi:unnamed protein product [Phaedon cochleariae]|uniref:Uncharacterized protein n=1 Tax=Phaedon cochleariae TaxID=80249 RepID=A0A9P0DRD1_PHACE|nr:unnamed protein product [Phaedon cochleariae]